MITTINTLQILQKLQNSTKITKQKNHQRNVFAIAKIFLCCFYHSFLFQSLDHSH